MALSVDKRGHALYRAEMSSVRKKRPVEFDDAKLQTLTEPITLNVEKVVNGRPNPVEFPVKPGETVSGKGWSADDVRQVALYLKQQYPDGGLFRGLATGDNHEQMQFEHYFPERPTSTFEGLPAGTPIMPFAQPGIAQGLPASQTWLQPRPMTPLPSAAYPGFYPPGAGQFQTPYGYGGYYGGVPPVAAPVTTDPSRSEREARLALEGRLERERLENQYKEQIGAVTQELRRVQESVSARPSGESEQVRLMKEELARECAAREADKSESKMLAMMTANQQQTQQLIQSVQQASQQQIAAMQAQLAAAPRGPDPTMMMFVEAQKAQAQAGAEAARANADAQKEIARIQADAQKETNKNSLGPREMIDLMGRMNVGQEQMASMFGKAWELMQKGVEAILSAQGPGTHPALAMVGEGLQGGLQLAQRALELQEQKAQAGERTAQVRAAYEAQAKMAQAGVTQQLAGPPAGAAPAQEEEEQDPSPEDELKETEEKLFGPALEAVRRLRKGVADGHLTPELAAAGLVNGIKHFIEQKQPVPAFELWKKGEIAQLVDVLLPQAIASFREQMNATLFAMVQQARAEAEKARAAGS